MSDQYVGEIRMFSGSYAPAGWQMCNGQVLSISSYEVLFTVLGAVYGGDGRTTFALPDLRGRVPLHISSAYALGSWAGTETVTLTEAQLPTHTHAVKASSLPGAADSPSNAYWAVSPANQYANTAPNNVMNPALISSIGSNAAHANVMPFGVLTFIIATQGLYPSPN